ncbi:YdcF family protein [Jiangella anatolica]|uniref:GdmH transporter n=1 Tax=Jiangella anatolica TaxID=2670374 RepID=A0A2W2BMF8_9ACTN|nr:YdcF family protein [Jiangella anatolica]PZF81494.1 GdmH transporter [Jiangella anatolica]
MTLARTLAWGAAAVLLWGEYEHWRASRRRLGAAPATRPGREAVVVLGYRDAGPRANVMNRWRVRAGLRSRRPELGPSVLVMCGGSTAGADSEAELMARYARERGYDGELLLEPASRTTWENIRNAVPLIADADRIAIVSHPLHAEKGRAYLHRIAPELARRLVRGADYRFGEWILLKPALAVHGRRRLRRLDRRR